MVAFFIFKLVIFAALLIFVSYYFVYETAMKLLERRRIKTSGESVQATVLDYKIQKDSSGVNRYYPVLKYTTKENQEITVQSKKERYDKYKVGKQLTVYYMPSNPTEFYISGLIPYIKITTLLIGTAGALLLLFEIVKMFKKI